MMYLVILWLLIPQRETFYDYFEVGVAQVESGQYLEAIDNLENAIALRPNSSEQARTYSVITIVYVPYYHLAKAHLLSDHYEEAEAALKKAFEYEEHEFDKNRYLPELQIMGQVLENLKDRETPTPDQPEFGPVLEFYLTNQYDRALAYWNDLADQFPDNAVVIGNRDNLAEFIKNEQERQRGEARINSRIDELSKNAREAEAEGDFDAALTYFLNLLALNPENAEALAGETRISAKLAEAGRTEQEIALVRKSAAEAQKDLVSQLDALKRENIRLKRQRSELLKTTNRRIREVKPAVGKIDVDWNVIPHRKLVADIQATISSNFELVKATLLINDSEVTKWDINGKRRFPAPTLLNYQFEKVNNRLVILARDKDDNTYTHSFGFNWPYKRTLFGREFWKMLIFSLVLVVFLALFLRQYQRRRAFRERFNPYIAGAPVLNDGMFFGRQEILKHILNTLHNNSIMIFGERRIGKTSFLHRLNKELPRVDDPDYQFIPVFIDLQGVQESDFFQIMDQEIAMVVESMDVVLESEEGTITSRQFISRLRKTVNKLKEYCSKKPKLVLLLDEVDVMNGYSERTNQQLRSVFMKGFADHIVAVMAGIHIDKNWKSEGSPWYNFFEQVQLKPFKKGHADKLITKPVLGIYNYTNDALERIVTLTSGKPYLIQKMCLNLVSHALIENKRKVTLEDVDFVYNEIKQELLRS